MMDYAQAREAASRAAAAHTASAFQSSLHSALRQPSPYETPRYETPRYDATPRAYGGPAGAYDVNRSDLNVRSAYEDRRATTPYEEPRAAEPRPRPYDYRTSAPPPGPRYASAMKPEETAAAMPTAKASWPTMVRRSTSVSVWQAASCASLEKRSTECARP